MEMGIHNKDNKKQRIKVFKKKVKEKIQMKNDETKETKYKMNTIK